MENLQNRLFDYPSTPTKEIREYIESKKLSNFAKISQEFDQMSVFGNAHEIVVIVAHGQKLYAKNITRSKKEGDEILEFFELITGQELKQLGKQILKTDI